MKSGKATDLFIEKFTGTSDMADLLGGVDGGWRDAANRAGYFELMSCLFALFFPPR
jgi:hypothetical protein